MACRIPSAGLRRSEDGRTMLAVYREAPVFNRLFAAPLAAEWNRACFSRWPRFGGDPPWLRFGKKIPYTKGQFDVVYLLHIIEHCHEYELAPMMSELHRIIKPGGTLRISTPDLELEARIYLSMLERLHNDPTVENEAGHLLAVTRMIDQCVRAQIGGEMLKVAAARQWKEADYRAIYGAALDDFITQRVATCSRWAKVVKKDPRDLISLFVQRIMLVMSKGHPAVTGEYDLVKPDFFMISDVLKRAGFTDMKKCAVDESRIPDWRRWNFDCAPQGYPVEPGLYLEAKRTL